MGLWPSDGPGLGSVVGMGRRIVALELVVLPSDWFGGARFVCFVVDIDAH